MNQKSLVLGATMQHALVQNEMLSYACCRSHFFHTCHSTFPAFSAGYTFSLIWHQQNAFRSRVCIKFHHFLKCSYAPWLLPSKKISLFSLISEVKIVHDIAVATLPWMSRFKLLLILLRSRTQYWIGKVKTGKDMKMAENYSLYKSFTVMDHKHISALT